MKKIKNQQFIMEILSEEDVYKRIVEKINSKRKEDRLKPEEERSFWSLPNYKLFSKLGFSAQVSYEIQKFINGEKLSDTKSRPLHKKKLCELCEKVGLELLNTYYGIK